jgi:hypothetical protein
MPLILPRLPQSEPSWPDFQIWWQEMATAIEENFNSLESVALDTATALAAANAASDAADNATSVAEEVSTQNVLAGSWVTGLALSAASAGASATINISAHIRHYPQADGSIVDVAVNAGSVTGLAFSTLYYLYYDDPALAGGAVVYHATTVENDAAMIGDRHTVGAVKTPASGGAGTSGSGTRPPGTRAVDISTL